MSPENEAGILLAFAFGMFGLFAAVCILIVPLKYAFRLLLNSTVGGLLILLFNAFGALLGFHIRLNAVTAALVGILGLPGMLLVLFFHYLI